MAEYKTLSGLDLDIGGFTESVTRSKQTLEEVSRKGRGIGVKPKTEDPELEGGFLAGIAEVINLFRENNYEPIQTSEDSTTTPKDKVLDEYSKLIKSEIIQDVMKEVSTLGESPNKLEDIYTSMDTDFVTLENQPTVDSEGETLEIEQTKPLGLMSKVVPVTTKDKPVMAETPTQPDLKASVDTEILSPTFLNAIGITGSLTEKGVQTEVKKILKEQGMSDEEIANLVNNSLAALPDAKKNIEDMPPLGAGDPIKMSTEFSITDDDNNFSQSNLANAMNSIQDNPWFSALVLGTSRFETGGDGLVDEVALSRQNIMDLPTERNKNGQAKNAIRRRLENAGIVTVDNVITDLYSAEAVFNARYGNREDLGNTQEGDGNRFKGRGLVQLTGRRNYQIIQDRLAAKGIDIDLVNNPELANDERYALPIALTYLQSVNQENAKEMGPHKLTRLINRYEDERDTTRRWNAFTANLTGIDAMDARLSDEKEAQRTAGLTGSAIDGIIGTQSIAAMTTYLEREGATIPENATPYDLVRLVNGAGVQG